MFAVQRSNPDNQKSLTKKLNRWLITLLVFACTPVVHAAMVTYTYTGQNYSGGASPYSTAMAVTASFTFASPIAPNTLAVGTLVPTTWSISDGVDTITSGPLLFDVATNSAGAIIAWAFDTEFSIGTGFLDITSVNDPGHLLVNIPSVGPAIICDNVCDAIWGVAVGHAVILAGNQGTPGTWVTPSATVPEPSFVFPVITALFAFACIGAKRSAA